MKKKELMLMGFCVLSPCAWEAHASTFTISSLSIVRDNLPTGYEIIELQGTLIWGVGPNAINAGANRNSVYLHFNQYFGNVNVRIYNESGSLVYSGIVDTSAQQTFIIPISGDSNGFYTVELDNVVGFAEGYFEPNQH